MDVQMGFLDPCHVSQRSAHRTFMATRGECFPLPALIPQAGEDEDSVSLHELHTKGMGARAFSRIAPVARSTGATFGPPNSDKFVGFLTQIKLSPQKLCYSTRVRQIVAEIKGASPPFHGAPTVGRRGFGSNDAGLFF
jgi:hypothetical protein